MTVNKLDTGKYQARFQYEGKRYKKNFSTAKEARAWEAQTLQQLAAGKSLTFQKDIRPLSTLADLWLQIHGYSLKDGKRRHSKLIHIINLMGNPPAHRFNALTFTAYRSARLEAGITANNCNRELTYLKAMFNELARVEQWRGDNPLAKLRPLKFDEKEMYFLTQDEISDLLRECEASKSGHLQYVVRLCLATGARWNEAAQLHRSNLQIIDDRARVIYEGTKSGKVRRVPISIDLAKQLQQQASNGVYFFGDCTGAFRRAVERAEIELPRGQLTHVLRHTFASHFVMNGGDLLQLKEILGHSTMTMTLRYAHLAPEALEQAIQFNPLKQQAQKSPQ
ncbi:tyrosine-type recombinase/integrase [Oceanobacter sp. 3_MG-2023]|uniref:phage integrase n=1 Tax=Oceanobacter sp. 3_MG-2023 TaxID=3062622 RepID=UPI002734AA1E|nr:tyrosine-type recombinase/integrase [Oceanobacter sp. 3_MG-2023]MDP2505630.1 tyrosine-type recombinase/integrase [Oceanobacter sp. 3_MG-2023]